MKPSIVRSSSTDIWPAAGVPLHTVSAPLLESNFLPNIDGSTLALAQHGVAAMLFGPESGTGLLLLAFNGIRWPAPLRHLWHPTARPPRPQDQVPFFPPLLCPGYPRHASFISPSFLRALRLFSPDVIHLIGPIWLGVRALSSFALLFPHTPLVTSHHTNLPTYAAGFGYPYFAHRTWAVHAYLHSFARQTLVPSASTAGLLRERGFDNLCARGGWMRGCSRPPSGERDSATPGPRPSAQ
ncbi:hypothetical protein DFH09DRAFT_1307893 [Mycena vulgaris]|nr:hypothetical protein DFH09DRAFT_1307893 [Mycena vulgaris]